MKRAYKYRFYPTAEQVELLARTFGCVRFVYNSILRWRTDAYDERRDKMGYVQASARLTALKKEPEFAWPMMFPACRSSSRYATNRLPLRTSSPGVPHILHSKVSAISRALN